MDLETLLLLFTGGCVGGLLAGLLGVGGGLIFVPIFTNYLISLEVPDNNLAQLIIANSMTVIFFAGISGSVKHYLNGNFYLKPILKCGFAASLSSVSTTYLINHTHWYNKQLFAVLFVSIALYVAYDIFSRKSDLNGAITKEDNSTVRFLQTGASGGILAALSGVGGGIIMIPILTRVMNINIKKATAISLGIITVMALVSSVYAMLIKTTVTIPYTYGLIIFPMVIPVAAGCIICTPFGVTLAKRIQERVLQVLFAIFLVLVVLNMIYHLWL